MTDSLTLGLAQINPTVGDLDGNRSLIAEARRAGAASGCDLVLCPELSVSGYPPEDLVLRTGFIDAVAATVQELAKETATGPALLVGAPWRQDGLLYNAALLLEEGRIAGVVRKHALPNYGVFDEVRVFASGPLPDPLPFRGNTLGVLICEDMWREGPAEQLARQGAELLLVINGSPFEADKGHARLDPALARIRATGRALAYVNQVGGQDELVFDGASFVLDHGGTAQARLKSFAPDFRAVTFARRGATLVPRPGPIEAEPQGPDMLYRAMVLGLRDYVEKNAFPGVLIGLSGGVDSALTAAVAVDALGADRVHGVLMPSPYTSQRSRDDAEALATALGLRFDVLPIDPAMAAFETILKDVFAGHPRDTTEENIQARARGMILMALSNKFGSLVLSTGNKSEMSVGYSTLYGDMCGGYSVLKDVYKTTVYALCRWRNGTRPEGGLGPARVVIPDSILTRAPTAELRPDQTDQDSLPPYEILDDILKGLIEEALTTEAIVARGHDRALVLRVWRMVNIAEYKRRQAPPGVKLTSRSFGRDRRYPITNSFSGP